MTVTISKNIHTEITVNDSSYNYENMDSINDIQNQDIISTYKEINALLKKYFNNISFQINTVTILLKNSFKIVLTNTKYYSDCFECDNLSVYCLDKDYDKFITVNKIKYDNNLLNVDKRASNSNIVDFFPIIYYSNEESSSQLSINVGKICIDDTIITETSIKLRTNILK